MWKNTGSILYAVIGIKSADTGGLKGIDPIAQIMSERLSVITNLIEKHWQKRNDFIKSVKLIAESKLQYIGGIS